MTKEITFVVPTLGNITVFTDGVEGGSSISSELDLEVCPFCDTSTCFYDCDGSKAEFEDGNDPDETEDEIFGRAKYNASISAVESLTLALVSAFDVRDIAVEGKLKEAFEEALQTSIYAIGNNT